MAEDLSSREILKQVVERLDLLERVLGTNTARLHIIEQHLGIVLPQQPLHEALPGQSGETHPATSQVNAQPATSQVEIHLATFQVEMPPLAFQVETPDLNISEATQPGPVAPQVRKSSEQT